MSKVVNFSDSTAKQGVVDALAAISGNGAYFDADISEVVVKAIMMGIADYAKVLATKDSKQAITIPDLKKQVVLTAVIEYEKAEGGEEDTGNYTISYGFEEPEEGVQVHPVSDPVSFGTFCSRAALFHLELKDPYKVYYLALSSAIALKQWLDENASKDEEVILRVDGFFDACVQFKDEKKVFSIVPYGYMKTPIKNDAKDQK